MGHGSRVKCMRLTPFCIFGLIMSGSFHPPMSHDLWGLRWAPTAGVHGCTGILLIFKIALFLQWLKLQSNKLHRMCVLWYVRVWSLIHIVSRPSHSNPLWLKTCRQKRNETILYYYKYGNVSIIYIYIHHPRLSTSWSTIALRCMGSRYLLWLHPNKWIGFYKPSMGELRW